MGPPAASQWLSAITDREPAMFRVLARSYGGHEPAELRVPLIDKTIRTFIDRFGDWPIRVFRCPSRINLRGMHVDTHGGYLNLMTHQRELIVVSEPSHDTTSTVWNTDTSFSSVIIDLAQLEDPQPFQGWTDFVNLPSVRARVISQRGDWSNYVEGAILRAQRQWPGKSMVGMRAVVGSDIPCAASLSSSTALSLGIFMSVAAANNLIPAATECIPIVQDIEWYAGARIGSSDQTAMLIPRAGELLNFAPPFDPAQSRAQLFPQDLRVLVINSHTERYLSGAHQLRFTRNRFAYSIALEILHREMIRDGVGENIVRTMTRFADFSATALESLGGNRALYAWLLRVPESISFEGLRERYPMAAMEDAYSSYFGHLPVLERPTEFNLRGPLLYGLSESERARIFYDALAAREYRAAGELMNVGHDGDRSIDANGALWVRSYDDGELRRLSRTNTPIERVSGAYGASSPVLDLLVDCARGAGAIGASLTGAGIAGSVLALCETGAVEVVSQKIRELLRSEKLQRLAPRLTNLSEQEIDASVEINRSPASAGFLEYGE